MACGGVPIEIPEEMDISSYCEIEHFNGNAAFIVNINAKGQKGKFEFEKRNGAGEDISNLHNVFINTLGFKWINPDNHSHQDLSLDQWDHSEATTKTVWEFLGQNCPTNCLRCRIRSHDHTSSKCFVLAISSHGQELSETEVIFSDGQSLKLTEIFEALSDESIPSLRGKPRILFLQVCRSNFKDKDKVMAMQDRGAMIYVQHDTPQSKGNQASTQGASGSTAEDPLTYATSTEEDENEDSTLQLIALGKMPSNFLLVYPSVSGQRSQRSEVYGSWLIYGLNKVIEENYFNPGASPKPVNILKCLTKVGAYVARERETIAYKKDSEGKDLKDSYGNKILDETRAGIKTAVCLHHRLTDNIIFYPQTRKQPDLDIPPFNFSSMKKKKKNKVAL